jgi:hypothetical protein
MIYGYFYRLVMRIAHRYHWHYAPPLYPEGDTMLWCEWCGFRAVIHRHGEPLSPLDLFAMPPDELRRALE